MRLTQTHLGVINRKSTEFVSVKTLNCSLRFICKAIRNKGLLTKVCQPHLQDILFNFCLPQLLIDQKDVQTWNENQVEYVRMQVDYMNEWNVKRTNEDFIQGVCRIRQQRRVKISKYLTEFMNLVVQSMTAQGQS